MHSLQTCSLNNDVTRNSDLQKNELFPERCLSATDVVSEGKNIPRRPSNSNLHVECAGMRAMKLAAILAGLVILGTIAKGGGTAVTQSASTEQKDQAPLWSTDLTGDYTLGSKIMKSADFGSQSVSHYEFEVLRNLHLFDKYYLQFGFNSERFDFSRSNSIYPSSIQSLDAEVSLSYWTGDDFYPLLKLQPGVYYTNNHITANSFDVPIRAVAGIKTVETVYLVLGVDADPYESEPITPVCGFNWKINDQYNLRAVFPEPRFSYNPDKKVELFITADLVGGGYRNGPTNDRRTSNAVLDYSEYRAASGLNYNPRKGLSVEMSAGWSFQRRFEYYHAGPDDASKGAPYFKLDLSIDL